MYQYQSKRRISTDTLRQLKLDLDLFLKQRKVVPCKILKRNVSLAKLPEVITERYDVKRRLQAFEVAIDIIHYARKYTEKLLGGCICYEFRGYSADGRIVIVHLREEVVHKDRILFLVSCATK